MFYVAALPSPLNLPDHSDTFSDVTRNDGIVVVLLLLLLQRRRRRKVNMKMKMKIRRPSVQCRTCTAVTLLSPDDLPQVAGQEHCTADA